MTRATDEEHRQVTEALAAVGEPCLPESIEEYRVAIYHALYDLACKRVIPPEIRLSVEIVSERPGKWTLKFSKDLTDWLNTWEPSKGRSHLG